MDALPSDRDPRARAGARLRGLLRRLVREALAERRALLPPLRQSQAGLRAQAEAQAHRLRATARALEALQADLRSWAAPFHAGMTIDQAWRRHPGAARVFARHHLPACDACAVRFDETLDEAAQAYGLDLGELLAELTQLLEPTGPSLG